MIKAVLMMLILGLTMGLMLAVAAQLFYVKVDERIAEVRKLLPGYDCGGCGYSGCSAFAEALCTRKSDNVKLCRPSKPEGRKAIVDYLAATPDAEGHTIALNI